jgi:hypothetical protein
MSSIVLRLLNVETFRIVVILKTFMVHEFVLVCVVMDFRGNLPFPVAGNVHDRGASHHDMLSPMQFLVGRCDCSERVEIRGAPSGEGSPLRRGGRAM